MSFMNRMTFERKAWHVDMIGCLLLIAMTTYAAYWTRNHPKEKATSEVVIHESNHLSPYSLCKDGHPAKNWRCEDGVHL